MMRYAVTVTAVLLAGIWSGVAVADSQAISEAAPSTSLLPVRSGAIHVLVDDLDDNGLADLAFTSHGGNFIQVHRQTSPRHFESSAEQPIGGFHPNDMIALPGTPKRYLINAEGAGALRVVTSDADGKLTQVSEYPIKAPRSATPFNWPGWETSLAISPYSGKNLTLLRGFDAEQGKTKAAVTLTIGVEPTHVRVADLNGDGVEDLALTARQKNEIWAVEYPGPDKEPVPRRLWAFQRGWPRHVIPLDIDRNGTMDLLVPMAIEQKIVLLLNDGKGNFSEGHSIPYPGEAGIHSLTAGQDRDGTRYLVAGGIRTWVLYRELKDSPGSFENILLPMGTWPNWLVLKDIDGDGWLDAVAAVQGGPLSVVIYGPLWEAFTKLAATGS